MVHYLRVPNPMKRRRNVFWLHRLVSLLMALHVLNLSVDPPDQHVRVTALGVVQEDLSVNEMESVGEWVLEHVFGIIVEEHDEPDEEGKIIKAFIKHLFCQRLAYILAPQPSATDLGKSVIIPFVSRPYRSQTADVFSPPPQRV
jgi:hypothetical protein